RLGAGGGEGGAGRGAGHDRGRGHVHGLAHPRTAHLTHLTGQPPGSRAHTTGRTRGRTGRDHGRTRGRRPALGRGPHALRCSPSWRRQISCPLRWPSIIPWPTKETTWSTRSTRVPLEVASKVQVMIAVDRTCPSRVSVSVVTSQRSGSTAQYCPAE